MSSYSISYSYCAASSCKNNARERSELSYFRFPKDQQRCMNWIINSGLHGLKKYSVERCYSNFRLCSEHFELSMFSSLLKNRLKRTAIPTLFDTNSQTSVNENVFQPTTCKLPKLEVYSSNNCGSSIMYINVELINGVRSESDSSTNGYINNGVINHDKMAEINSESSTIRNFDAVFIKEEIDSEPDGANIKIETYDITQHNSFNEPNPDVTLNLNQDVNDNTHGKVEIKIEETYVPFENIKQLECEEIIIKDEMCVDDFHADVQDVERKTADLTEKRYTCNLCDFKTVHRSSLQSHMRKHSEEKPFVCNFCEYKTHHKGSLRNHVMTHTGEKLFACNLCDYKSACKVNLKNHMSKHTGEKQFACSLCEYKTAYQASFSKHMRSHRGEKPYSCNYCEFKCVNRITLKKHMNKHAGQTSFACNMCEVNDLKDCVCYKVEKKVHSCELCGYKCEHKYVLKKHIMASHTGEKPFACHLCEFKCVAKYYLKHHVDFVHSVEKPFACDLCEFKTKRKDMLKRHMLAHNGVFFTCDFCEFKTVRKENLKAHVGLHTGEKPFVCNICGHKSSHKRYLSGHMKSHREKAFACELCDFKATRKRYLDNHVKGHARKELLICEVCKFRTIKQKAFKEHKCARETVTQ